MTLAIFSIQDSQRRFQFFEETSLLAEISMEINLEIPFLLFSNIDIEFTNLGKFIW